MLLSAAAGAAGAVGSVQLPEWLRQSLSMPVAPASLHSGPYTAHTHSALLTHSPVSRPLVAATHHKTTFN